LLAAIKEKFGNSVSEVTKPQLKDVFLGLGYDKETIEELPEEEETGEGEGEEGEEAKPARPPPKKEVSQFAEQTFDLIAASRDPVQLPSTAQSVDAIDLTYLLPTLQLCKSGYGEPSLRFALKVADVEGAGALKERPLWTALVRCTNTNFDSIARNHLRRAVGCLMRTRCQFLPYLPPEDATLNLPPVRAPVLCSGGQPRSNRSRGRKGRPRKVPMAAEKRPRLRRRERGRERGKTLLTGNPLLRRLLPRKRRSRSRALRM
jgi:hypothetical protein